MPDPAPQDQLSTPNSSSPDNGVPLDRRTTTAAAGDRYRQLQAISYAINRVHVIHDFVDATEWDQARFQYEGGIEETLGNMAESLHSSSADQAAAREAILTDPTEADLAVWEDQEDLDVLREAWSQTRHDLDHDIVDAGGIVMMIGMVDERDELVAELDRRVAELQQDVTDRDRRLALRTQNLADLASENVGLTSKVQELVHENTGLRSALDECEGRAPRIDEVDTATDDEDELDEENLELLEES